MFQLCRPVACLLISALLCTEAKAAERQPTERLHISHSQAMTELSQIGSQVERLHSGKDTHGSSACHVKDYGTGWGSHRLCALEPAPCSFWSFGVSHDWTFDQNLVDDGCTGMAFDPSVSLNSQLAAGLIFSQIAANMFTSAEKENGWIYAGVPQMMDAFQAHHLDVLKLDCEGCEFAVSGDILKAGFNIFRTIDQVVVELHLSDAFLKSQDHVIELGKLFFLLRAADLQLIDAQITELADYHETGCDRLADTGYPCKQHAACHNLLFARKSLFGARRALSLVS